MTKINTKDQWLALNRINYFYRLICFSLIGCLIFTTGILGYYITLPPVVVEKSKFFTIRHSSQRANITIEKAEIEQFVKDFIVTRYSLSSNQKNLMFKRLKPIVTEDFYKLIVKKESSKTKTKKGLQYTQYIGKVDVSVTDKEIVAQFDKITRFKGVPLITVMQVSIQIIKESANLSNPLGLYVNGLIEHRVK